MTPHYEVVVSFPNSRRPHCGMEKNLFLVGRNASAISRSLVHASSRPQFLSRDGPRPTALYTDGDAWARSGN